jgi:hypothetical protein
LGYWQDIWVNLIHSIFSLDTYLEWISDCSAWKLRKEYYPQQSSFSIWAGSTTGKNQCQWKQSVTQATDCIQTSYWESSRHSYSGTFQW